MAGFAQPNLMAHLQVLSVGAAEASPTCLVITDRDRFMINVGEGTQRLGMEHKVRLTRLFDHIFLTGLTPECFGGLPGMILTLADCGKTALTVHGPVGTRQLLRSTTHFMRRDDLKVTVREYDAAGLAVQGQALAMHALPLTPAAAAPAGAHHDGQPAEEPASKRARPSEEEKEGGGGGGSKSKAAGPVIAWAGRTADLQGKFDVAKAKALGIPPGPVYGQLKSGRPATLPDGRVVQPAEVVGPPTPGALFGFLLCPDDPAYVANLPPPEAWLGAFGLAGEAVAGERRHLNCLVHYTAAATAGLPAYRAWMAGFGPGTTHILAALPRGTHRSPFRAARLNNLRLHLLDPKIFPRAPAFTGPDDSDGSSSGSSVAEGKEGVAGGAGASVGKEVLWAENLLKYHLAPRNKEGVDRGVVLGDVTEADEAALRAEAEAKQLPLGGAVATSPSTAAPASTSEPAAAAEGEAATAPGDDVEVVFLGTGSAIPSKYRNVSGIYVRVPVPVGEADTKGGGGNEVEAETRGFLLDVGEGSLGQLASLYEGDDLCRVLLGLRAIWVSHPHADHHLGLMRVLEARREAARRLHQATAGSAGSAAAGSAVEPPPVLILAPRPVLAWLREYRRFDPEASWAPAVAGEAGAGAAAAGGQDPYLVDLERMTPSAFAFLKAELGVRNLVNVPVHHCPFAFAAVIDAVAGWRLVYSGDTRPCERLVQAGKGATVLIHEATFEATKAAEAVERKHSTVDEALDVARRMGAAAVILTHFSQRYPKFPVLPADSGLRVCVAFDLMRVRFRDIPRAARLLPALQQLFPAEEEDGPTAATAGAGEE